MENNYIKNISFSYTKIRPSDINKIISLLSIKVGTVKSFKIFPKVVKFHFENNVLDINKEIINTVEDSTNLIFKCKK